MYITCLHCYFLPTCNLLKRSDVQIHIPNVEGFTCKANSMSEDELKNLEQKAEVRLNGWMSEKDADRRKSNDKSRSFKQTVWQWIIQTPDSGSFLFINFLTISIWKTGFCRLDIWWHTFWGILALDGMVWEGWFLWINVGKFTIGGSISYR